MSTELGDTNGTAMQALARVPVNWREVVLFGLLAYGLAWVWWGFLFFPYLGTLLTQSTTPANLVAQAGVAVCWAGSPRCLLLSPCGFSSARKG